MTKRVLNILKDYGPVISAIALIVAIWSVTQSNRTAHKIANGDYQAEQQIKTEEVH
ncbi:MAG: hypothetical protein K0U41_07830 [Gammaproteobacteria bacterium]|nr:hypothetical protein [Gammaproteobacteria bacterium]